MTFTCTLKSGRHLLLAAAAGALMALPLTAGASHAAIGMPPQNSNNPSGLNDLLRKAQQAMAQGHPNVAVIYLKNASNLAPRNVNVRMELGYAFLRSGDPTSAVRELRQARHDGAPDAKVLPLLFEAMLAHREGEQLIDQFPPPSPGDHSPLAAVTLRSRGAAQIQLGHPDLAVDSLDQALAISRDVPTLVARAQLAKSQNDADMAMKLIDEASSKAPNDATVLLMKLSLLQAANRAQEALGPANTMVKLYGDNPTSLLARAGVYLQLKQDAKARADVDAVLDRWKNLPQALYYKALILERAHDTRDAWNIAQALPPEFTSSRPEVAGLVAEMANAAGHSDVAMSILSAAVSKFPDSPEPRIYLASHYLRINNAQRALDTLMPLKDSQEPRVMLLLGQAYAMERQFGKSTEYFEKASATGFGSNLLKKQIAASSLKSGNLDAAVKELRDLNDKQPDDPVTAGLLITALLRDNDIASASQVADKLAASAPKSPYGPLFQGQLLLTKTDYKGAIAAFSRAIAADPKFVPALYDRAVARAGSGDIAGSNADIQAVLTADPKNVMAMIRAAELAMRTGQDPKAQALLQRAVATEPKNSVPNLALTSFYLTRHRIDEAAAAVGAFLKLVPTDVNAQAIQAELQLAGGQADAALATFRRLSNSHPDSAELQVLIGSTLAVKKDIKGAMAAYQRAVQLSPKLDSARTTLIHYALAIKDGDTALAAAQDGVKQDPGPQSDLMLASTLTALKKNDEAVTVLKQSVAQHPSEAAAVMLSQLLRESKDARQADAVLTDWIAKHPNDVAARLEYAQGQMAANPAAAERQFHAVLKLEPDNMVALNNLAWVLQKKSPKEALAYAEQAAKVAPDSAPVLDTLGWVKWQSKDAAGALPLLQRAHAVDASNGEITYHLAVVLNATGHRAEAKRTLDELLANKQDFSGRREAEALNVRLR